MTLLIESTVVPAGTYTSAPTAVTITNEEGGAIHLPVRITAFTGGTSPTLTVTVSGVDPASGQTYPLLASAALAATGTTVLKIGPGLTAAANTVANDMVPRTIQVSFAFGGAPTNIQFSVGAILGS